MAVNSSWQPTLVEGQEEEWIPLLKIGDAGSRIGISRKGDWLIGGAQECVRMGSQSTGVRALPILEQRPLDVIETLTASLRDHGLNEADAELPACVAIETGLSGGSDYWAKLALDWLEIVGPSKQILELLPVVADARWASQRTRQLAKKLWKRFADRADSKRE